MNAVNAACQLQWAYSEQPKNNNSTHISPPTLLINPSKSHSHAAYENPNEIHQFTKKFTNNLVLWVFDKNPLTAEAAKC
jgi:hypothetical protein